MSKSILNVFEGMNLGKINWILCVIEYYIFQSYSHISFQTSEERFHSQ